MGVTGPTLHMLCGKIASGKSTLAARLAQDGQAVLVSEDAWLSALYPDEMTTPADYVRHAERLRGIMGPHLVSVLKAGLSVVLDFPANTVANRAWMRGLFEAAGAAHHLHLLETPDALCLARLRARNARGDHPFKVTEAQFHQFAKHYAPPTPQEGFSIVVQSGAV